MDVNHYEGSDGTAKCCAGTVTKLQTESNDLKTRVKRLEEQAEKEQQKIKNKTL